MLKVRHFVTVLTSPKSAMSRQRPPGRKGDTMARTAGDSLEQLIDAARRAKISDPEREEQRRSFAYGNTKIENERVTRETVNQEAEKLKTRAR